MPIEIRDLDDGIGTIIFGSGVLGGEEYVNAVITHLTQDRAKSKKYSYWLADYTELIETNITSSDIDFVAKLCKEIAVIIPKGIIAIAAVKDLSIELSRMWKQIFGETNWEVKVFRKREDAVEWLKKKIKEEFQIDDSFLVQHYD